MIKEICEGTTAQQAVILYFAALRAWSSMLYRNI